MTRTSRSRQIDFSFYFSGGIPIETILIDHVAQDAFPLICRWLIQVITRTRHDAMHQNK